MFIHSSRDYWGIFCPQSKATQRHKKSLSIVGFSVWVLIDRWW